MNSNQSAALHLWNLIHAKPISPFTPAVSLKLTRFLTDKQINLPPSVSHRVCCHCGIVSVPGITTLVAIEYGSRSGINVRRYRRKKSLKCSRCLVYTCLVCHSKQVIESNLINESAPINLNLRVALPLALPLAKDLVLTLALSPKSTAPFAAKWTPPAKIDANAKSRERQKKRKQNSLSSLLANKKKNDKDKERVNSLNLMEFMK